MSAKQKNNGKPAQSPPPANVFPAFPEPQGWSLNWDGTALAGVRRDGARPKPTAKR